MHNIIIKQLNEDDDTILVNDTTPSSLNSENNEKSKSRKSSQK